MILQGDRLYSMVSGALEWFAEDGMHRFCRHTSGQIGYYARNEGALIRALASAGICIDMETDAGELRFEYRYAPGSSRNICRFDIQVNGQTISSPGEDGNESGEGEVCIRLPEGKKRLTVWLPCLKRVWIGPVRLEGASFAQPHDAGEYLLTLGDSITQGYDAVHPSQTYNARLATSLGMYLINQSVGGAVFDRASLEKIPGPEPRIVLCWFGTNDWNGRQRGEFLREMRAYISALAETYPDSRIFVLTPLWRADAHERGETACGTIGQVAQDIREACLDHPNIGIIDGDGLIPHEVNLFADGFLHPNDGGFAWIAENLTEILRNVLTAGEE